MTSCVENETKVTFPFDMKTILEQVMETVTEMEKCPYETSVSLLVTDNEGIRQFNRDYRGIDSETDVLSFPNITFDRAGDFSVVESGAADFFDPDSGELILGDIIISADRVLAQAQEYGHSVQREFSFLVVHSLLHLFGYDHMQEGERLLMEDLQRRIMAELKISR